MLEKCSTAQSFIRTEMTTYRIGTLDQWFALEKQKFEAQFDTYCYLH